MTARRCAAAVPALVLVALVGQAGLAGPARAAGVRYAAPTGTSAQSCLTPETACNIQKAVGGAATGDEVVLAPGTYAASATISRGAANLSVHGAAGQPRPLLVSSGPTGLALTGAGARVSDLTIQHTGALYGLNVFASGISVERVEVWTTGGVACGAGTSGVVRDSLCVTSAAGGIALDDSWGSGTGTLHLRNVTAAATGTGSYGVRADASGSGTDLDVVARNVIASGVLADVRSTRVGTGSDSDVVLSTSSYDTTETAAGGSVTAAGTGGNQKAAPLLSATYRQLPGSPTVDAGGADDRTGTVDLDGDPRVGAPDIGADELVPAPPGPDPGPGTAAPDTTAPDTLLRQRPRARTSRRSAFFTFLTSEPATTTCRLDGGPATACASPYRVRVGRGRHTLTVTARDLAGNVDATPATCSWKVRAQRHRR